jgi:steroid delta-isomerase-like uncharacterized protein
MKSPNFANVKCTTYVLIVVILAFVSCQPADHSATLKPIIDGYVEAWNTGNLDNLDQFVDADFVRTAPASSNSTAVGIDSLKSVINGFRTAFPDFKVTIDDVIYGANSTSISWTVTGTNTGPMGMPPTGKSIEISGVSISTYKNGKAIAEQAQFDNMSFMQQLGFAVLPPAPPLENDPIVTDPDHYSLVFENERVRAIRISYGPGEKSVMHDHRSGVLVSFDNSTGKMTLPDGSVIDSNTEARTASWADAGSHLPESTSNKTFELIYVELKN